MRNLDHLLISLPSAVDEYLGLQIYDEFQRAFLDTHSGNVELHDGTNCHFAEYQIEHAFRKTTGFEAGKAKKGGWEGARAKRIHWILPVIQAEASGVACYDIDAGREPGWDKFRRIYIFQRYVVWLHTISQNRGLEFSSAYLVDDVKTLRKYSKFGRKLL